MLGAVAVVLGLAAPAHATGYSKSTFDTCTQSACSVPDTDLRPKASITGVMVNVYVSGHGQVEIELCMRPYNSTIPSCDEPGIVFYNQSAQPVYKEFFLTPYLWSAPGAAATDYAFFTYGGNGQFLSWEVDY